MECADRCTLGPPGQRPTVIPASSKSTSGGRRAGRCSGAGGVRHGSLEGSEGCRTPTPARRSASGCTPLPHTGAVARLVRLRRHGASPRRVRSRPAVPVAIGLGRYECRAQRNSHASVAHDRIVSVFWRARSSESILARGAPSVVDASTQSPAPIAGGLNSGWSPWSGPVSCHAVRSAHDRPWARVGEAAVVLTHHWRRAGPPGRYASRRLPPRTDGDGAAGAPRGAPRLRPHRTGRRLPRQPSVPVGRHPEQAEERTRHRFPAGRDATASAHPEC
jgi:hypothetical protein